jgi:phage virion morphogenesis protein
MLQVAVNDKNVRIQLNNFTQRIGKGSLLRVFGEVMRGSIEQTFREQGSPAGSWAPLAASTLLRDRMRGAGRKILIRSGRLKNSITYAIVGGARLLIGTNLRYAGIHQLGGEAGRRAPFKKKLVIGRIFQHVRTWCFAQKIRCGCKKQAMHSLQRRHEAVV